jgi:hypothetical protein
MVVVVGALLLGKNVNDLFGATADKVKPAP